MKHHQIKYFINKNFQDPPTATDWFKYFKLLKHILISRVWGTGRIAVTTWRPSSSGSTTRTGRRQAALWSPQSYPGQTSPLVFDDLLNWRCCNNSGSRGTREEELHIHHLTLNQSLNILSGDIDMLHICTYTVKSPGGKPSKMWRIFIITWRSKTK